jgi:hypothetical protein
LSKSDGLEWDIRCDPLSMDFPFVIIKGGREGVKKVSKRGSTSVAAAKCAQRVTDLERNASRIANSESKSNRSPSWNRKASRLLIGRRGDTAIPAPEGVVGSLVAAEVTVVDLSEKHHRPRAVGAAWIGRVLHPSRQSADLSR